MSIFADSIALGRDFFGSTSAPVVMYIVSCTGSESTLLHCGFYVGSSYSSYGTSGVACAPSELNEIFNFFSQMIQEVQR